MLRLILLKYSYEFLKYYIYGFKIYFQNFISLEPGRHILRECSNFVEISFSTNKPKQSVHIFLLNDYLLVASKKKRQVSKDTTKAKLVADRCFSLEDITLIDMRDTEGLLNTNVFICNNLFYIQSNN